MNRFVLTCVLLTAVVSQHLSADWQCNVSYSLAVASTPGNQWNAHVAGDGNNGAYVVWQDRRDGVLDKLYVQHIDSKGNPTWQANGIPLCQTGGYQYYPQIIEDGSGGAIITWQDNRTGSDYDIYAQRVGPDGTLSWNIAGVPVCTAPGHQYNPHLVSDQFGGVIFTWQDHRGATYDIYAQHLGPSGNALWSANGVVICDADSNQLDPQITTDGMGGAILAWTDYRPGNLYPDIYGQRVNNDGVIAWGTKGKAVCVATNTQSYAQLVSDGANGAIICWDDRRSGTVDQVYSQRIDVNGNPMWGSSGVQATTSTGIQYNARLVGDGSGGAVVVWQDNRKGSDYDIYAQHLDMSGAMLWSPAGRPICTAAGHQCNPQISFDYSSVLFTWQDKRNGSNFDVYAQRASLNGSLDWTLDGQLVFQSAYDKVNPACASDGVGGLTIAWSDFGDNSGFTNIKAQRIGANGKIAGGCFRSFTQSDYAVKAVRFSSPRRGVITMPNVGNLRDSLFLRGAFPTGIDAGVSRPDSVRQYAWLHFGRSSNVKAAVPQTGPARPFDLINGRVFRGKLQNPTVLRYNNQIVGELLATKLNIAASDRGMIPRGLGDLVYSDADPSNPLNHKTLRQIVGYVDTLLTLWKTHSLFNYDQIGVSLSTINNAFTGDVDTLSTRPLSFAPAGALFSSGILNPNPGTKTSVVPAFHRNVVEKNVSGSKAVLQNFPNPFNPVTQIRFELSLKSVVSLKVYNVLGQEIATLYNREVLDEGTRYAEFDGSRLSSGTYFYRLTMESPEASAPAVTVLNKMLLIK